MGHYDDFYEFYKDRPCPPYETGRIDREQYLVHKKIKKSQTNDEWRKTCSAEEFAEWITDKINVKVGMALHDAELYNGDVDEKEYMENEDEWLKWLKQQIKREEDEPC